MPPMRIIAAIAIAFVVAAVGIGVQIAAGASYPAVPPGAIILIVAAGICLWWTRWWALFVPAVAAVFLLVGGALNTDNLGAGGGRTWGTVLQLVAIVVALVAVIAGLVRERRAG